MKQITKKLWMLVSVILVSIQAFAYDFEVDGIYYNIVSLDDLTCEVTHGDDKYSDRVTIPSDVSYNNRQLKVIAIGDNAFWYSKSLVEVTIGDSLESIGSKAFEGCESLERILIPNSIKNIGSRVFCGCIALSSIILPNSVEKIPAEAFSMCESLTSITIPNSVRIIERNAFSSCKSLNSVVIGNSVEKIAKEAFRGCSSLLSVSIPNAVTSIEYDTFRNCTSLQTITLSEALRVIEYGTFNGCMSLTELTIPGSVYTVSQTYKYSSDYNLTFGGCENLEKLRILHSDANLYPSYTYIDAGIYNHKETNWYDWTNTVKECYLDRLLDRDIPVPNLEKLELGESIKKVQIENVKEMNKLTTIESHALTPPELPEMSNVQYMNVTIMVPEEALEAYKLDSVWGKFWNLQANGVWNMEADTAHKTAIGLFDLNGRHVSEDYKGLVFVRFSDGTCKKMLNR